MLSSTGQAKGVSKRIVSKDFSENVSKKAPILEKHIQGRSQGERGEIPPPPKPKKCRRKMVLFPKALVFATNFQKIIKNSIFL